MKVYDIKCPLCGTVNKNLYLDETNGWMECEHCCQVVMVLSADEISHKKVPAYTPHKFTLRFGAAH
ncbi:MAG: translation initiation factor 2 [Oscillospiraceae bacterium]|nr:translation initiation factor 2 [Oscillospiraceae bacterium]